MSDPGAADPFGPWMGPYLAAALALMLSGAAKLRAPRPAADALRAVGLPVPSALVRVFAAGECAIGLAALLIGHGAPAVLVAGLYLLFALVLGALLRRTERVGSCGCLGERTVAPNPWHLGLVLAGARAATAAALAGAAGVPEILRTAPLAATGVLVGAAALVHAAFLVATELPSALSAYRPANHGPRSSSVRPPTPSFAIRSAR